MPSGLLAVTSAAALTYVGNKAVTSATPAIARFTPSVLRPGQPTMLGGSNFMATATGAVDPTVTIGGAPAPVIGAPSPSSVSVRVPMGITTVAGGQQTPVTLVADPSGSATATSSVMVVPDAVTLTDVTLRARSGRLGRAGAAQPGEYLIQVAALQDGLRGDEVLAGEPCQFRGGGHDQPAPQRPLLDVGHRIVGEVRPQHVAHRFWIEHAAVRDQAAQFSDSGGLATAKGSVQPDDHPSMVWRKAPSSTPAARSLLQCWRWNEGTILAWCWT